MSSGGDLVVASVALRQLADGGTGVRLKSNAEAKLIIMLIVLHHLFHHFYEIYCCLNLIKFSHFKCCVAFRSMYEAIKLLLKLQNVPGLYQFFN